MSNVEPFNLVPVGATFAKVSPEDYVCIAAHTWHLHSKGYAQRTLKVDGKWTTRLMHREIMQPQGRSVVDHRNRDRLDNRRGNLRDTSQSVNLAVAHPKAGVRFHLGAWRAQFRNKHLGTFPSRAAAEAARKIAWEAHVSG